MTPQLTPFKSDFGQPHELDPVKQVAEHRIGSYTQGRMFIGSTVVNLELEDKKKRVDAGKFFTQKVMTNIRPEIPAQSMPSAEQPSVGSGTEIITQNPVSTSTEAGVEPLGTVNDLDTARRIREARQALSQIPDGRTGLDAAA